MTKADRIIAFAREQVGEPYRLGAAGWDVWDCSGLTKMAVKQIGYYFYHGATTQWERGHAQGDPTRYGYWSDAGTIDTLPNKVALLFNRDKSRTDKLVMAHTGIYDGRGNVVQAGGQYPGVSDKPLNKSRWSHWATLKGADEVTEPTVLAKKAYIDLPKEQNVFHRIAPNSNSQWWGRIDGGEEIAMVGIENGWVRAIYNGKDGYIDARYVTQDAPQGGTVPETDIDKAALIAEAKGLAARLNAILNLL